ncbi:hypothetical protein V6N12_010679 [Hibiscus sabdariffa]|uniref:Putative plant transposon protein domain-containing protein n=1 Tax=Hibiscus sabdariffa TaxID=183260 RepID=A0ABR2EKS7_9ROSI
MTGQTSHMADKFSPQLNNIATKERYNQVVIHKKIWEEQGFKFDDDLDFYGLETIIYQRLHELGWLKFGRQPARANVNYAREFYAHNASGENTVVNVRGRLVPAHSAAINQILDLPENQPNIYQLMDALEDVDYNDIKDALCLKGTKWNTTGRNPGAVSHPNLLPEAKLWNTIVKRNLMPTSHNQTVDRKRLVLIHCIIFGTKFNVREVIARELSEACRNDKSILAFPCLISALCRHHRVPTYATDEYTDFHTGWDRKHYLKKMDVSDAIIIQVAMPIPAQSENTEVPAPAPATAPAHAPAPHEEPAKSEPTTPHVAHQRSTSVALTAHGSLAATPPSPPEANPPSPVPTTETPPLYIQHMRSQIQRIEAR